MRVRFRPHMHNFANTSGLTPAYGAVCWFVQRNSGSPAPPSMTVAFQFDASQPSTIQDEITVGCKATSATEMLFQNVTATSATWSIGVAMDILTALTVYGVVFVEHLVQFRSKD